MSNTFNFYGIPFPDTELDTVTRQRLAMLAFSNLFVPATKMFNFLCNKDKLAMVVKEFSYVLNIHSDTGNYSNKPVEEGNDDNKIDYFLLLDENFYEFASTEDWYTEVDFAERVIEWVNVFSFPSYWELQKSAEVLDLNFRLINELIFFQIKKKRIPVGKIIEYFRQFAFTLSENGIDSVLDTYLEVKSCRDNTKQIL